MRDSDVYGTLSVLRPEHAEYIGNLFLPLLCHLEDKVIHELLHRDLKIDLDNLVLPPPHDDLYWMYILPIVDMGLGNIEAYREEQKAFEKAWNKLRRRIFLQKGEFQIAEKVEDDWNDDWM